MSTQMRRMVISTLAVPLLAGCQIGSDISERWQDLSSIAKFVRDGGSQSTISRSAVTAVPFASLGFRYGKSPQALVTLAQSQSDKLYWVSRDGLSIVTEHGRIVQTSGFPGNLSGGETASQDPLALPHMQGWADRSFNRTVDFGDDYGFGHTMMCTLKAAGQEEITVLGSTFTALKYLEKCKVPTLNWSFENTHWMDARTGFLWRTRQWVSPSHKKPVELEVLRPAAEDRSWQIHSSLTFAG